jgi:hypothetical protein
VLTRKHRYDQSIELVVQINVGASMKTKRVVISIVTSLLLGLFVAEASAESIRLKCETRGTARSKISVDGRGFANNKVFTASVTSGSVTINSPLLRAKRPVRGEVEFDFDSDRGDIRTGATAIPSTFIKGNSVTASIIDAQGFAVTASASCKARK